MEQTLSIKSKARTARIAGLLYTLMIPLAAFGILFIPTKFIAGGDAAATINNILLNEGTLRLGMVSALLVQVCHIFIVLLLYRLLKPADRNMAALMVVFMLVSIPIAMMNEMNHLAVIALAHSGENAALIPQLFSLYDGGIMISGIFWGLWLFPMGVCVYKSGFLPKAVGVILLVASAFYVTDSFLALAVAGYKGTTITALMHIPMFGEILFPLWLLIRGIQPSLQAAQ